MITLMLRNFKITYLLSIYVVFKTFLTLQFNRRNNFILRRCRIVCVECGTVWSVFGEGVWGSVEQVWGGSVGQCGAGLGRECGADGCVVCLCVCVCVSASFGLL